MVGSYMGENASTAAKAGDGNGVYLSYANGPLALGVASAKTTTGAGTEVKTSNFGGAYDLKVVKLMAESNTVSATGAVDVKGTLMGFTAPLAGGTFKFSNASLKQGDAQTKRNAIGFVQPLSKRTSLFATYARNSNSGGASRALNGATTAANGSSTGYDLGLNHTF
jgi:hypothetical protein